MTLHEIEKESIIVLTSIIAARTIIDYLTTIIFPLLPWMLTGPNQNAA